MQNTEDRRKFLKYGFIAVTTLFAATTSVKFDTNKEFTVGEMKIPKLGVAEANAMCGMGMGCGGGGGECGTGMGCGGGGGECGIGMRCSGG